MRPHRSGMTTSLPLWTVTISRTNCVLSSSFTSTSRSASFAKAVSTSAPGSVSTISHWTRSRRLSMSTTHRTTNRITVSSSLTRTSAPDARCVSIGARPMSSLLANSKARWQIRRPNSALTVAHGISTLGSVTSRMGTRMECAGRRDV